MTKEYGNMNDFSPNLVSVCSGLLSTARLKSRRITGQAAGNWINHHLTTTFRMLDACRTAAVEHPLYQEVKP